MTNNRFSGESFFSPSQMTASSSGFSLKTSSSGALFRESSGAQAGAQRAYRFMTDYRPHPAEWLGVSFEIPGAFPNCEQNVLHDLVGDVGIAQNIQRHTK